jgi:asparagine synthase (glutamine-hydrolysing)
MGRALYRLLPEDVYDRQPVTGGDGRFMLVADIRVDNREALLPSLGLTLAEASLLSDAALLMRAYERWQEKLIDHVVGDFAFALWDEADKSLLLVRDALGQRPLHYFLGKGFIAFASMPRALWALEGIEPGLDAQRIAEFVADLRLPDSGTYFAGIERVLPGEIVRLSACGVKKRRYWQPSFKPIRFARDDDYVQAMREQLDAATRSRLRGAEKLVASHLSGGWDSSAVTATAARLMAPTGGQVLAFTSAPREGFDGPVPRGRVADESPFAGMTAALYPNVEHIIARDRRLSPLSLLPEMHHFYHHPVRQLDSGPWWSDINKMARSRGTQVMLIGHYGNLTINAAGLGLLADLIRTGKFISWWREARLSVAKSPARWRGVFANSLGPWLPAPAWSFLRRKYFGASPLENTPYLLNREWAHRVDATDKPGRDGRPARNSYQVRYQLMRDWDQGYARKGSLGGWGIDERDPLADRRLIEFCLSLPHDQLLKNGVTRPLARAALADRLPSSLQGAPRGLQGAGWYESLKRDEMAAHVARIGDCSLSSSILDVDRLQHMIDHWPQGSWNDHLVVQEYRQGLAMAVAAGHFIRTMGGARLE